MLLERAVLTGLHWIRTTETSRILCYHAVGTPQWGVNDVAPDVFESQMELALDLGYSFVSASELAETLATDNGRRLAITFDDGVRSVATNAAPILRRLGIPWTLFVVSDWAGGRHPADADLLLTWREIDRLAGMGAVIGSHSRSHPDFGRLDPAAVEAELVQSREAIRCHLGITASDFAIPLGQRANWSLGAQRLAEQMGYTRVYSQAERTRLPGTIARTFITRLDHGPIFRGALRGAFANWEEWY